MQGKLVWALAIFAILVIIGPANGCKHCGTHWCSCANTHQRTARPQYSRSWEVDNGPATLHLTLPVVQPQALSALGLGGLGRSGGSGGLGRSGGLGGRNLCELCGGYSRAHPGYSPREDYGEYPRGYSCRCSPRRNRYRYDDY